MKKADETGWNLAGENCWLWLGAGRKVACFLVHPRRNGEAFQELLGPQVKGMLVSDRHGTYNQVTAERREVCWSHLKRDFLRCPARADDGKLETASGVKQSGSLGWATAQGCPIERLERGAGWVVTIWIARG